MQNGFLYYLLRACISFKNNIYPQSFHMAYVRYLIIWSKSLYHLWFGISSNYSLPRYIYGIFQNKMAPSFPTVDNTFPSGERLAFVMAPLWPRPSCVIRPLTQFQTCKNWKLPDKIIDILGNVYFFYFFIYLFILNFVDTCVYCFDTGD